jgi:hypothetical protein
MSATHDQVPGQTKAAGECAKLIQRCSENRGEATHLCVKDSPQGGMDIGQVAQCEQHVEQPPQQGACPRCCPHTAACCVCCTATCTGWIQCSTWVLPRRVFPCRVPGYVSSWQRTYAGAGQGGPHQRTFLGMPFLGRQEENAAAVIDYATPMLLRGAGDGVLAMIV